MSDESWKQERYLSTQLTSLERDFESRLSYFVQAADAGGGTSRNRRRLAAGRELLKYIGEALDISFHRLPEQRTRVLIPLREAISERLATVTSAGFIWKRREPLLPDFDIESIAAAFEAATSDTIFALDNSLDPSEVPAESSRSRSPVPRSLVTPSGVERVAVPPVPRIEGCPTPTPPTPRPVIAGQKTPLPPKARPKGSEPSIPGPTRAPHIESAPPVGFSEPSSSSTAVSARPAATIVVPDEEDPAAEASTPTELCVLYPSNDLWPVINWSAEAIRQGYRRLITLDEHKVADRDIAQTTVLVRTALSKGVAIAVLSYIPDSSLASHGQNALDLWRGVLSSIDFPLELAPLPIIVTPKPKGPAGKASTIRYVRNHLFWSHELEFRDWTHIDDRGDIVAEINSDRFLRAICWDPRDRRSLLKLCQDNQLV